MFLVCVHCLTSSVTEMIRAHKVHVTLSSHATVFTSRPDKTHLYRKIDLNSLMHEEFRPISDIIRIFITGAGIWGRVVDLICICINSSHVGYYNFGIANESGNGTKRPGHMRVA